MKTKYSSYLASVDDTLHSLHKILSDYYEYVSILATDVSGLSVRVGQKQKSVSDYWMSERGFVVRVYKNGLYSEYSFNVLDKANINELATKIRLQLDKQLAIIDRKHYQIYRTAMIQEVETELFVEREVKKLPEDVGVEQVVELLTSISDSGVKADKRVFEAMASVSMVHVNKLFISSKKHLRQSYVWSEGSLAGLARSDGKVKMDYRVYSGLKGAEILDEMANGMNEVITSVIELFEADRVIPGEYDIICTPEISGLIAHEAFGHGVEMDMFVKNRSLAKDYIDKPVAAKLVEMHDGAIIADNTSSYIFDDEGVVAQDTTIINAGILKTGICDTLSALRLDKLPTGNGKRQSFERKAYTRMTNTIFCKGDNTLAEMMAGIKHGYLLEGVHSGMEDPKNWGIQCMLTKGREIINGEFTGKIVSPVIMTGYVPDLLKSIDMVGTDIEVFGSGYCGKGYKEYVKAADGGPYLRAKARLG